MSYNFEVHKNRVALRSDLTLRLTHLTKARRKIEPSVSFGRKGQAAASALDMLMEILESGKLKGSTGARYINGRRKAVCFQEIPIVALGEMFYQEKLLKEAGGEPVDEADFRYNLFGLSFSKSYVWKRSGRSVVYEQRSVARRMLPAEDWWRIVDTNWHNPTEKLVDWTHEREWRVPDDFEFHLKDAIVLLPGPTAWKAFLAHQKQKDHDFVSKVQAIVPVSVALSETDDRACVGVQLAPPTIGAMTTTTSAVAQFRDQMTRRFERACRRRQQMWDALYQDDTAVGDGLAAMVAALKEVMYDFCQYAERQGLTKKGTGPKCYDLINHWRASNLSGQENIAWGQIDQLRHFEVHTRPADTRVKEIDRQTWDTVDSIVRQICPGFDGFQLKDEMESRLHVTVIVEKDANAAALAEWKSGVGREMPGDSMCMLTLGTGVGAGIVLDRKLWHGMIGMGGEGGHIPLVEDGFACGCGGRGCLEQYASATAIGRAATLAAARGGAPRIAKLIAHRIQQHGEFTARDLAGLARDGDEVARQIFADAGKYLGMALAMLVNVFNLPLYVIGGGVVSGWDLFAPRMFEELRRLSYIYGLTQPDVNQPFTAGKTYVVPAATGPDAGLLGAAMLPYLEADLL